MFWKCGTGAALVVVILSGRAFAGLGGPLPAGAGGALRQAKAALEQKGYSTACIDAAAEKLGPERAALLEQMAACPHAGGDYIYVGDLFAFLLFCLLVGALIYLIIVLIEAESEYHYRRY